MTADAETPSESKSSANRSLLGSSSRVGALTMLSRIFGLMRDVVIARLLGAEAAADTFFVAFKIPNFFRRLFGEGAFNVAFVPVLSDYQKHRSAAEVRDLIAHTAGAMGLVLTLLTVLVVMGAPLVTMLFAPGFLSDPHKFELASSMIRITFPYLLLICMTGIAAAVLNCYDRFAVPAFTPVLLNVCLISAALVVSPMFDQPVYALAWGVLVAGVVQLLFELPFLARLHLLPMPRLNWRHEGVVRVLKLMAPAVLGASVYQINLLVDTMLASFLPTGSVSWLYYSDRLTELPLGVFAIAIATVVLPSLSRQRFDNDPGKFGETLDWAIRMVVLIGLPAAVALIVLSQPILATLFQYGELGDHDVHMASYSLKAYALGLLAFMLIKVLATGYFAREDTKTPVRIGVFAMLVNIVLNLSFVGVFQLLWGTGHVGLALATTASAYLNVCLLFRGLRKESVYQTNGPRFVRFRVIFLAALLMGCVLWWMQAVLWIEGDALGLIGRAWRLTAMCAVGSAIYGLCLLACGLRPRHLSYS